MVEPLTAEEAALYVRNHTWSIVQELLAVIRRDPDAKIKRTFEVPGPTRTLYVTVALEYR